MGSQISFIYPAPSSSLVRTSASQAENTGSNPVGATRYHNLSQGIARHSKYKSLVKNVTDTFIC